MQGNAQTQGWHTSEWGTWGWTETILKLIGIAAGLVAFVRALPSASNGLTIGGHPHLAAIIVLVLVSLAAILQVVIRLQQRETISFIFAILNLLGHLGLLLSLLWLPPERTLPLIFGVFWLLGQLTKIQFLRVTGYTESGATSSAMVRTTVVIAVIYLLFVIFMLI
ncbi:MAG TPA: hypothetical protein VHD90_20135 [Phototrophicaceae bacterium]|nr:hypothetical protein [Phototrophicaceae bacterium]